MAAYSSAPQASAAFIPAHSQPLGPLPFELVNYIYSFILEKETTAVILPQVLPGIGSYYNVGTNTIEPMIISSRCALLHTCKASRIIYYNMLKGKVLARQMDRLRVVIEDLDFTSFIISFLNRIPDFGPAWRDYLKEKTIANIRFTDAFLKNPNKENFTSWLQYRDNDIDQAPSRPWRFKAYVFSPVSVVYADRLKDFLNIFVYERVEIGHELRQFTHQFQQKFSKPSFIKEGPELEVRGRWVGWDWVTEVAEEGKQFEDEVPGEGIKGMEEIFDEGATNIRETRPKRKARGGSVAGMQGSVKKMKKKR